MIDYDEWLIDNEEELIIKYAETGEDREFDFDLEHSLKTWESIKNIAGEIMTKAERIGLLQINLFKANQEQDLGKISALDFSKLEIEILVKQLEIFQEGE